MRLQVKSGGIVFLGVIKESVASNVMLNKNYTVILTSAGTGKAMDSNKMVKGEFIISIPAISLRGEIEFTTKIFDQVTF